MYVEPPQTRGVLVSARHSLGNATRVGCFAGGVCSPDPVAVLTLGRRVCGGTNEHCRFARSDPNPSESRCHALFPSMPLRSVVELRDPFLLGWGVGGVLRS